MAFENLQLPDWTRVNQLFNPAQMQLLQNQAAASNYLPGEAALQLQTGQQNLDDRSTLRWLAPGIASGDPNAIAGAAALPTVGGTNTISALGNFNAQTALSKLNLLQFGMGLPRVAGSPPGANPAASPGNSPAASPTALGGSNIPPGMATAESGNNPQAVNAQGYSGNFQFGTGRLTDLGLYQPAQGENPNGNQWQGTFTIPGFPNVQTHQDFLNNPDAQRMAAEVHFKDIGNAIDSTPGAQDFNRNGLAAVAQLGGVAGMQQFVATGGQYNPHDSNGTSLQNYYQRFAQSGTPALQQAFGHPSGPLPANHPARQYASANGTAGMPQIATDAVAAPGPAPAPGSTTPATPQDVQSLIDSFRNPAATAPAAPADQQVNVDPSYAANKEAPVPGQGMTAPQAVAQAQAELGDALRTMAPEAANAAVTQRAQQILNGAPPLSQPSTPTPAVGAPQGAPQGAPAPAPIAPHPVMPGSGVMTTQPYADQRFPAAVQSPAAPATGAPPAVQQASAPAPQQASPQAMGRPWGRSCRREPRRS